MISETCKGRLAILSTFSIISALDVRLIAWGFTPFKKRFLRSAIKEAPQEYPDERRKQVRVSKAFKIVYPTPKAFINSYLSNISPGGLFIKTNAPPNQGEKFNLKISFSDEEKELEVLCEVAWSRREEWVKKFPPGIGVKFLDLSPEDKKRVIRILSRSIT
jgi:uncharacterized protein (TIGR02266 family)